MPVLACQYCRNRISRPRARRTSTAYDRLATHQRRCARNPQRDLRPVMARGLDAVRDLTQAMGTMGDAMAGTAQAARALTNVMPPAPRIADEATERCGGTCGTATETTARSGRGLPTRRICPTCRGAWKRTSSGWTWRAGAPASPTIQT